MKKIASFTIDHIKLQPGVYVEFIRDYKDEVNRNLSSVMRFNVADNAQILNAMGRPMNFVNLVPGLRVRVCHADFMTMSIPPQTTAFAVRVIR